VLVSCGYTGTLTHGHAERLTMMGAPADETWLHPSPRLRSLRRAQVLVACAVAALAVLILTAGIVLSGKEPDVPRIAFLVVAILIGGVLLDRFTQRRVGAWSYREREDDLMVRRGVLFTRLSVIPYGRMQYIDVVAGPIERAFGLATVRMHTAAAFSDARIPGLTFDEAARLRDHLAELGEAKAAGL
jgi:uncharacterized protein